MWYLWSAFLLVWSALTAGTAAAAPAQVGAETGAQAGAQATTRAPPRTLDRQAAELAWRSWLQSPESGNQNAPPRRITTKSLFITPLVCPKGQRLDTNGCVQVVTVNKDEHERILLEQLNALFTSAPSSDVIYDYGDEQPGPLQLSIPISLEPQAQPLHAQEPSAQAHEQQPTYAKPDKKDENSDSTAGLVAELELLQLQHSQNALNDTNSAETANILNHNVLQVVDKPKRGADNSTEVETNDSEEGQKGVIYGHVKVDPVLYSTEVETETETEITSSTTESDTEAPTTTDIPTTTIANSIEIADNNTTTNTTDNTSNTDNTAAEKSENTNSTNTLKKESDQIKLNPENDYADIGEAIKLISRYAEVTTDDNFSKDQKKYALRDDSILGTRTKLQYRRNRPKPTEILQPPPNAQTLFEVAPSGKLPPRYAYHKKDVHYRYPSQGPNSPTPPPDYPFRHIQDYWPGRNQVGGVYSVGRENPRRHHHMIPHNYRAHGLSDPYGNFPGVNLGPQEYQPYAGSFQPYPRRAAGAGAGGEQYVLPMRSHTTNQDLYTLLGLRHWFSSEGSAKR